MENMLINTKYLASKLNKSGKFEIINEEVIFPLITVKLKSSEFTEFQLSDKLREKGWIIPSYTLPPHADDITVMRMVVKENFSRDLVDMLYDHILKACNELEEANGKKQRKEDHSLLY
jgi:glutamate decarboxylase